LIFTDKKFCSDGQMFATAPDAVPAGDKLIVNGAIQPFFQVARRKYRFRLLNTGSARIWTFSLSDGRPFSLIATDGNVLDHPVQKTSLELHVAPRYAVILDFSGNSIGDKIYLLNIAPQFVSNAPEPLPDPNVNINNVVMRFDVTSDAADHS